MNTNPTGLVTDAPVREAGGVPLPAGTQQRVSARGRSGGPAEPRAAPPAAPGGKVGAGSLQPRGAAPPLPRSPGMLGASQRDSPPSRPLSVLGCVPLSAAAGAGSGGTAAARLGELPHPAGGCRQAGMRRRTHGGIREGIPARRDAGWDAPVLPSPLRAAEESAGPGARRCGGCECGGGIGLSAVRPPPARRRGPADIARRGEARPALGERRSAGAGLRGKGRQRQEQGLPGLVEHPPTWNCPPARAPEHEPPASLPARIAPQ